MRTAVFITPESLLSPQPSAGGNGERGGAPMFRLASHAVNAITRLKQAGFVIIGLGRTELFHGFATLGSCREFLTASALDDVIIPQTGETNERCANAMIQAAGKWLLDLDRSFFIGRNEEEISAVQLTGCTPFRITASGTKPTFPAQSDGLPEAVDQILALSSASAECL